MATILSPATIEDIQKILSDTVTNIRGNKVGSGILLFDASYLYCFAKEDMPTVSKLCKLGRYDNKYAKEWHNYLERCYNDQTVPFKPLQLNRKMDRVVNEGLEIVARCLTGDTGTYFHFHAIGEGDLENALASDDALVDELNRIDMNETNEGGSVSRDGSTLYFVGNHPSSLQSATITETGIFDSDTPPTDVMLDHSVFDPGIDHDQFEDSAGSTTVVYMCGI